MPSSTLSRLEHQSQPAPAARHDGPRTTLLWSSTVVARWAGAAGLGALALVGSWFAIGGEAVWRDQRPWMALGIASLVLIAFVSVNLLLAGRRAIGLRRVQLLGELPLPQQPASRAVLAAPVTTGPVSDLLVAGDGRLRFHRADCPLTAGRGYLATDRAAHAAAGRLPCGVCLP